MRKSRNKVIIGDIFKNNKGLLFRVLAKRDKEYQIIFLNSKLKRYARSSAILKGAVPHKSKSRELGELGEGKYKTKDHPEVYSVWRSLLSRTLSKDVAKCYQDVTICDEWLNFQNFCEWASTRWRKGYELDKDAIQIGNKEYNPEVCTFIPRELNRAIVRGFFSTDFTLKPNRHGSYHVDRRWGGQRQDSTHRSFEDARLADYRLRILQLEYYIEKYKGEIDPSIMDNFTHLRNKLILFIDQSS